METAASAWEHDPSNLCDFDESRKMLWESYCVVTPPAGLTWTKQLSPHIQRNKQLQDTLLQMEEELARLQEENKKLRGFLNSSFVRNLQEKAKKLTADRRRKLKRNLKNSVHEPSQTCSHSFTQQITRRLCRNLTAEFCSESSEGPACSEPNLDLWVLRTLGLKDRNTIDTSGESPSECNFRNLVYDDGINSTLPAEHTPSLTFNSPVPLSTLPSVQSYWQTPAGETDYRSSEPGYAAMPTQTCSGSPENFTAPVLTEFQPDRPETCSISGAQPLQTSSRTISSNWFPHPDYCTPSDPDFVSFDSSSSSVLCESQLPSSDFSPTTQPDTSQPSKPPQTHHKGTDLAFSMSLSPSSSVKTHSFPQGQAFIRKDTGGRWNFTWVPRQEP
ncbi:geminin coiled-coil domain-containing protein 1 [Cyprinodon tularosa]|uniref:geminin coiled-coil domain-containing protein 1 n=1 Tax=Cyprinodon tularosa TaxID=77115 RepID=UPI0018E24DC5|nr:geminin coiled-coil domain-containing protein 1 [Cyprinodon tularosa]